MAISEDGASRDPFARGGLHRAGRDHRLAQWRQALEGKVTTGREPGGAGKNEHTKDGHA
jgi:hypothetical protein